MQLFNLFSAISGQYLNKYLTRVQDGVSHLPPGLNRDLLPDTAATPERPGLADKIFDAYLPADTENDEITNPVYTKPEASATQTTETDTATPVSTDEGTTTDETTENSEETTPAVSTPVTISRQAELGYNLTLQFDMATFTRTIERMADGELTEIDQLAVASFGLSTEFTLSGKEVINIETGQAGDQNGHALAKQSLKQRQASLFAAQSRDFKAFSFMREATDLRRMVDIKFKDNARRAVNKFSLRYRTDSQFSFSFAERLKVQTEQVTNQASESVGNYLDSAGEVAASGTNEMMSAFFDAVEGYLTTNKEQTMSSITSFFGEAATALGFSGTELAEYGENNLTNTIDSFFDRVSSAVSDLRALYLGNPAGTEPTSIEVAEVPADYSTPPVDTTTDELVAAPRQLAVA